MFFFSNSFSLVHFFEYIGSHSEKTIWLANPDGSIQTIPVSDTFALHATPRNAFRIPYRVAIANTNHAFLEDLHRLSLQGETLPSASDANIDLPFGNTLLTSNKFGQ